MKNFEQTSNQENRPEKDRQTFLEAVKNTTIREIETVFTEDATKALEGQLAETKLFLLGEKHGVKENPDIIYTLFKKFGFKNLALEWDSALAEKIEQFLTSGEIDFDAIKESPDGRITAGHFALIKKLREEGLLKKIICFDQSGEGSWNEGDENMARNILTNLSDTPTLVVAGSLHTKTEAMTFEDETSESHPMGEHVKKAIPNVPSGRIDYLSGEFHNFGTQRFDTRLPEMEQTPTRFSRTENDLYVFTLPEAHTATVPNPSKSL